MKTEILQEKTPIQPHKPVHVYKNTHTELWSIKQNDVVVAYAEKISLKDVEFRVQQSGLKKVRKKQQKGFCAYIHGYLHDIDLGEFDLDCIEFFRIYFNPYRFNSFVKQKTSEPIIKADFCQLDIRDVYAPVIGANLNEATLEEWL